MVSLHQQYVSEIGADGRESKVPALSPSRMKHVDYIHYKLPPSDSADRASVEEWLVRARFIEEDLHWLLKLPHDRFWCQVIFDNKVHQFIDSYLCDAPRCYDHVAALPTNRALPSEINDLQETLHRLFFFVCLRASTHRESSTHVIDPDEYGAILYENYVFDIARLMDICALFGQGSETSQLVGKMIDNVFTRQPKYTDDLKAVIPDILQILEAVGTKCGIHYDVTTQSIERPSQTVPKVQVPLVKMPIAEFEDIVLYLSDIAHTLCAFLKVYPSGATVFWNTNNFPIRLAAAYESLSAGFSSAFHLRMWVNAEQKSYLKKLFHRSQVCFLRAFRLTAYGACLKPVVEGKVNRSSVGSLIESYVDVMNDVLSEKHFIAHLHVLFPFSADRDVMHSSTYLVDEVRLKYIQDACDDAVSKFVKRQTKKPTKVDCVTVEDRSQTAVGRSSNEPERNGGGEFEGPDVDETGGACAAVVAEEQMEYMVSSVKDLLPDLGSGFIRLCLEEYVYDVERVINAVLEDRLLPSLQDVDRSLAFVPSVSHQVHSDDGHYDLERRLNVFDGDEFDVFSRGNVDLSRIHRGKRSDIDQGFTLATSEIKDRVVAYAYQPVDLVDKNNGDLDGVFEYDDEYDDTYDSNVVGIDDADSADELLSRRSFVTPRVLAGSHRIARDEDREDDSELLDDAAANAPPRDAFVEDPAKLRQMREEKYMARQQQQWSRRRGPPPANATAEAPRENHDVKGGPRGQGQSSDVLRNRAWKEKNKASRVNHNRKDLSDRKRRV